MPKERTEQQILSRAPLEIKLGDKDYRLKILPVMAMGEWRQKLIAAANDIGTLGISLAGLGAAFIAFPDKVIDLVFDYAPELVRDDVLQDATEEQFAVAFSEIMSVAFPFLRQLSLMKSVLTVSPLPSAKSTSSSSPSITSPQIM